MTTKYDFTEAVGVCECSHSQAIHRNYLIDDIIAKGHGACKNISCQCKRFTWIGWEKLPTLEAGKEE